MIGTERPSAVTSASDGLGDHLVSVQRQFRLISLLDAATAAGLEPTPVMRLHAVAYLSNVLAPVWDLSPAEGRVLKRRGGPFYPPLQRDLDRLVGMGIAVITNAGHVRDENNRWRLEGAYTLNAALAAGILEVALGFPEYRVVHAFNRELALALSALPNDDLDAFVDEDATYSDPLITDGNVVDFGEWRHINYSANAARYFADIIPGGGPATRGEQLHLYARHLYRLLHANA